MRIILLLLALVFSVVGYAINGDSNREQIKVKYWVSNDSIIIRWAPCNYNVWQLGNKYGYKVERLLLSKNGVIAQNNVITMLHDGVIKPLEEEEWRSVIEKDSVWAPIALQALWGKTFELTSSFKKNIKELYNKVEENQYRFGFALFVADRSPIVAKSLGLYYCDKHFSKTDKYIYRIYINNLENNEVVDTAYVVIDPNVKSFSIRPVKPDVNPMGDYHLLMWDASSDDYVGYNVERSFDGLHFEKINRDLVIPFQQKSRLHGFFADSLIGGNIFCWYRLVGITPFGFAGSYSDTVKLYSSIRIKSPINFKSQILKYHRIELSWDYKNEPFLEGFKIERKSSYSDSYSIISELLPATSRKWVDKYPQSNGYYRVLAISKTGFATRSLEVYAPLEDDEPPLAPVILKGNIDSLGKVSLIWKSSKESDVMGYRVFRGNDIKGEFVQVNLDIIKDTCFEDRIDIKTITKNVFYKLSAVDRRYNSSDYSNVYILIRPDVIRPISPIIQRVEKDIIGKKIFWNYPTNNDIKLVKLYRSVQGGDSLLVGVFSSIQCYATDLYVGKCTYWCYAVDSSGNISIRSNLVSSNGIRDTVKYLNSSAVVINVNEKPAVKLQWDCLKSCDFGLIYKRNIDGKYVLFKRISSDCNYFVDKDVQQGCSYSYFIKMSTFESEEIFVVLN